MPTTTSRTKTTRRTMTTGRKTRTRRIWTSKDRSEAACRDRAGAVLRRFSALSDPMEAGFLPHRRSSCARLSFADPPRQMKDETAEKDSAIFTIGHSNHPLEVFLALVEEHRIGLIVDVRSSPYAGYVAEFNREPIRNHLRGRGVEYLFLGDLLGGRPEGEEFYDREGYVRYDRLARSAQFQQGIERLLDAVEAPRAAR